MKKIFAFILCAVLLCAVPIVASAEETPIPDETVTQGNNSGAETVPETEQSMTEMIVGYVKSHVEEISVIITLILTMFYEIRKHGKLNGSIGTLNNNAVTVAEKSAAAINSALSKVEGVMDIVDGYKAKIETLLEEIRISEEEKKALADALVRVESYLNTAKIANMEFANELAELLCLANIPNSKKEELYARHMDGVHKLEAAEEVKSDDGQET